MSKEKLYIDLKPKKLWGKLLEHKVSTEKWNEIKENLIKKANNCCELCNAKNKKLLLEPRWDTFVEKGERVLRKILVVCEDCESVIHFGKSKVHGLETQALLHLQKVNKITESEAREQVTNAFIQWRKYCEAESNPNFVWKEIYDNIEISRHH